MDGAVDLKQAIGGGVALKMPVSLPPYRRESIQIAPKFAGSMRNVSGRPLPIVYGGTESAGQVTEGYRASISS